MYVMIVSRADNHPGGSESVTLSCIKGPKELYPDSVLDLEYGPYQTLYEIYTPNSEGSHRMWKDFEHYKSVSNPAASLGGNGVYAETVGFHPDAYSIGVANSFMVGYESWTSGSYLAPFGDVGSPDVGLPPFYVLTASDSFVPPPNNLSDLNTMALKTMLPIIQAELSLPNFIYELKDFKPVITKIASVFRSSAFIDAVKRLRISSNWSFQKLLRSVAGQYLNLQFNFLPLISDIGKIYSALSRTERRINDFITRAGRPQNKHFAYKWTEFVDPPPEEYTGSRIGYQNQWIMSKPFSLRFTKSAPTTFHAQIQYNYNYTGFQIAHAQLLGHLDALGINLNPAIIWNALPWTFVIDWVLGIGPYLNTMAEQSLRPEINVRRYLWSVTRERLIVVRKGIKNAYTGAILTSNELPAVKQTAYRRSVGMPSAASIQSSGLTLKEFTLGAALVIARRRRR